MANLLIRGLDEASVAEIDRIARERGLSRNEFLRRQLSEEYSGAPRPRLTRDDLIRAARVSADLLDDEVMAGAWR